MMMPCRQRHEKTFGLVSFLRTAMATAVIAQQQNRCALTTRASWAFRELKTSSPCLQIGSVTSPTCETSCTTVARVAIKNPGPAGQPDARHFLTCRIRIAMAAHGIHPDSESPGISSVMRQLIYDGEIDDGRGTF